MAVTQKNVIEDVIIGTYVDNISPTVSKMKTKVVDQTKQIERSFKDMGQTLKIVTGGMVGAIVQRQYAQLVAFAREHNTEAGKLANEYDKITDQMQMAVVSSESFKETMKAVNTIAEGLNKTVGFIVAGMDKLGISFFDLFGGIGMFTKAYTDFKDRFFPTEKEVGRTQEAQNAINKYFKDVTTWQGILKRSQEAAERGRLQEIADYQAMLELQRQIAASWAGFAGTGSVLGSVQFESNKMDMQADELKKYNDQLERLRQLVPKVADPNINARIERQEESINRYAETLKSRVAEMRSIWLDGWVNAFVAGFQAIGQSIVQGGNVLKAFVANFLSAIGQMAVQFGSMMILYGFAGQAVPFLGLNGAAAIAAGAALVTFGSALTALAGTMQKTAGSANYQSNYRPESNFQESQSNKQTTVQVIIQALDPTTVSDSVARNIGKIAYEEITKIEYLGRSPRFT